MAAASGHNLTAAKKDLEPALKKIEKLVEDGRAVQADISEIKKDLKGKGKGKGKGYNVKMINEALKLRAMDTESRQEQEDLRDMYLSALGLC